MRALLLATSAVFALTLGFATASAQTVQNTNPSANDHHPTAQENRAAPGTDERSRATGNSTATQRPTTGQNEPRSPAAGNDNRRTPTELGRAPNSSATPGTEPRNGEEPSHASEHAGTTPPQLGQAPNSSTTPGTEPGSGNERSQLNERNGTSPPQVGQAPNPQGGAATRTETGTENGRSRGEVQLDEHQRSEIHQHMGEFREGRVEHPGFAVTVGTVVPREVHLYPVPPDVVQIVPEYQGFDYVMVGSDLVIIDPESLRIVAVIPA